jgi:hypothetical protein
MIAVAALAGSLAAWHAPYNVQFVGEGVGEQVALSIDGGPVEKVFAGKLTFRDNNTMWQSVCADVRSPISAGQVFGVQLKKSSAVKEVSMAGRIVAMFFNNAKTPDQCAGLQLAVWKAIEDGDSQLDFGYGHVQVQANPAALNYAVYYFRSAQSTIGGAGIQGEATYFQAGFGQGRGTGQGQGQGVGQGPGQGGPGGNQGGQGQLSP